MATLRSIMSPLRPRLLAVGVVVVLTVMASYVVLGREYIPALDAFAYSDPTLTFTASRTSAPTGSVIHLAGAPDGAALVEFSSDGVVAYSPTFVDATGIATVVPPLFREGVLSSGDARVRLLAHRGPVWAASGRATFTVEAGSVAGPPGMASLFGLEVTRGMLLHAQQSAAAAAGAGALEAASTQAAALAQQLVESAALISQLEVIVAGKGTSLTRGDVIVDAAGIRLMDQLTAAYFGGLGPASPSPCGDAKDAEARTGLAASSAAVAKASAASFVRSVVDCEPAQVREIAERTSVWLTALTYGLGVAVLVPSVKAIAPAIAEATKYAGLLLISVASWGDEAVSATHLWKQYELGRDLRANLRERNATFVLGSDNELYVTYELQIGEGASERKTVRLPDHLVEAARQDTYLSAQIRRLLEKRAENEALEAALQDEEVEARVAQAVQARKATPTTPPPTPTPTPTPSPTATAAPATAAPTATLAVVTLPPTPGPLSYTLIAPPAMTAGRAVTFGFCAPRPASATALCGPASTNPKGGNPPYTFTYSVPRPNGLTFNSNGLVTGTPTASGPFSVEVCVKDLSGASVCRTVNGTIAAAPTPQPVACAGTAYAGTTWSGPLSVYNNRYSTTLTFTFGQPTYFASGCTVPIASVRTSDGARTWGLNTTYPYNYGSFNKLSCGAAACDYFTFTIELQSGPPLFSGFTLPAAPAKLIINVYAATVTATALTGNAGTGSSTGGCCSDGTFNLSRQ